MLSTSAGGYQAALNAIPIVKLAFERLTSVCSLFSVWISKSRFEAVQIAGLSKRLTGWSYL
ncbi:hypothetical protein CQ062_22180 [Ochrobactrum sp. MYb68]|nr:hypothetical protein CQ062_22180 [Ochrobactrum sp. MYb68]